MISCFSFSLPLTAITIIPHTATTVNDNDCSDKGEVKKDRVRRKTTNKNLTDGEGKGRNVLKERKYGLRRRGNGKTRREAIEREMKETVGECWKKESEKERR